MKQIKSQLVLLIVVVVKVKILSLTGPLLKSQCDTGTTIQPNSFTSDDNKFKSKIDMCNLKEWCDSISYEGGFMGKKVYLISQLYFSVTF